ncbi:MAG TPA: hypothetical protein PKN63_07545 [Chitinophagales bacterium]|nr:hypothetical protein [Chitinophagales bacterium]HNO47767.1 hypothetical protein [Chitinophagales bacterium]
MQKSFHLANAEKNFNFFSNALKKIKHPTHSQTISLKLNIDNGLQELTNRTTGYNTVLPKWRQKCYYETFVQGSTVVLLLNFSANIPPLRQYPNRYRAMQPTTVLKSTDGQKSTTLPKKLVNLKLKLDIENYGHTKSRTIRN